MFGLFRKTPKPKIMVYQVLYIPKGKMSLTEYTEYRNNEMQSLQKAARAYPKTTDVICMCIPTSNKDFKLDVFTIAI